MQEIVNRSLKTAKDRAMSTWNEYCWPIISTPLTVRPLHFAVTRLFSEIKSGDKVLELGSGYPWYEIYAGNVGQGGLFVALDNNPTIQRRAKFISKFIDHYLRGKEDSSRTVKQVVADYQHLPFKKNTFDQVLVSNGPHLDREVYRVLKPGGRVLIAHWSVGGLPILPLEDYFIYKNSGFEQLRLFPGAPGWFNPIHPDQLYFAWNWYLSAKKPARETIKRSSRKGK